MLKFCIEKGKNTLTDPEYSSMNRVHDVCVRFFLVLIEIFLERFACVCQVLVCSLLLTAPPPPAAPQACS